MLESALEGIFVDPKSEYYQPPEHDPGPDYDPDGDYTNTGGGSVFLAGAGGFGLGLLQGVCNLANGVQDAAIGMANLPATLANATAGGIDYLTGNDNPHSQIRIGYIPSPDWSRGLVTYEAGNTHGWSKMLAGEGALTLATGGISKLASAVDDAGRCGNVIARAVHGGCFVAGTLVTVSELPRDENFEHALWSQPSWSERADYLDLLCAEPLQAMAALANRPSHLVAIEQVPLGARVPTKNPKPWEYDDSLPEPDQDSWVKISLTVQRTDSGVVDAELLRPRQWADALGLAAGRLLPIDIQELQVQGTALIRAIEPCPLIAAGEGSPVTARFVTRQVDTIACIEVLGADGQVETIEGTTIHPIWSEDRQDWVPLGELAEGEQLCGASGPAIVLTATILPRSLPVYNIEVHGEHVYQVGTLGLLVHNACISRIRESPLLAREAERSGRRVQNSINDLFKKLWDGNLNPGLGTKPIGAGISEARAADGARVYFREIGNGLVEILGKSDKSNQGKVIAEILKVFG